MTLVSKMSCGFEGLQQMRVLRNKGAIEITLIDSHGKIQFISSLSGDQLLEVDAKIVEAPAQKPSKSKHFRQSSNLMLDSCNYEPSNSKEVQFKLKKLNLHVKADLQASSTICLERRFKERGLHRKILDINRINSEKFIVVY